MEEGPQERPQEPERADRGQFELVAIRGRTRIGIKFLFSFDELSGSDVSGKHRLDDTITHGSSVCKKIDVVV